MQEHSCRTFAVYRQMDVSVTVLLNEKATKTRFNFKFRLHWVSPLHADFS